MITTLVTFACLLIVNLVFFGYTNQHRGGGPFRINKFLGDKVGFDLGRSLFTATILTALFLSIAPLIFTHLSYIWVAGNAIGWLIWGLNGWGSYFDNGRWEFEYNDKPEVPWIDWILYLAFGAKWNPEQSTKPNRDKISWDIAEHGLPFPFALGFLPPDLVTSPTGDIRPFSWRKKRDTVGMFLRQLHATPLFIFNAWFFGNPLIIAGVIPFAVAVAAAYYICNLPAVENKILSWQINWFPNNVYLNFAPDKTGIAEVIAGLIWGIVFTILIL